MKCSHKFRVENFWIFFVFYLNQHLNHVTNMTQGSLFLIDFLKVKENKCKTSIKSVEELKYICEHLKRKKFLGNT